MLAAAPETINQHQGSGQPAFDPTFHHLAPSLQPPPRHPCGKPGPLRSGQKIRGICEGKMGFCEEKVKSGNISSDLLFANVRIRFAIRTYSTDCSPSP